jgi:hypothetical protein
MKVFSLHEANALIPEVRAILIKLRATYSGIVKMQRDAQHAAQGAEHGGGGMARGSRYIILLEQLAAGASKLDSLGVQIKDYQRGLIDFPSWREGKIVLLCWQLGEGDEVGWWHEIDAGFAGRQPL